MSNVTILPKKNTRDWLTYIRKVADDSGNIVITNHGRQRMMERNVTRKQMIKVFRCGTLTEEPHQTPKGDWKFTMRYHLCGEFISAAGALSLNERGEQIIVITVISEGVRR